MLIVFGNTPLFNIYNISFICYLCFICLRGCIVEANGEIIVFVFIDV